MNGKSNTGFPWWITAEGTVALAELPEEPQEVSVCTTLKSYRWRGHCRGLFHTPIAAKAGIRQGQGARALYAFLSLASGHFLNLINSPFQPSLARSSSVQN